MHHLVDLPAGNIEIFKCKVFMFPINIPFTYLVAYIIYFFHNV